MDVTGNLASKAEKEKLYNTLVNLDNWRQSFPELESFEKLGEHEYKMSLKIDIGPIKGEQSATVRLSELNSPNSANFEIENELIKTAKGSFTLKDPAQALAEDPANTPAEMPEGTKTFLAYNLDLDAGNPFFNAMLEGFKGKIKDGFEELLHALERKALAS